MNGALKLLAEAVSAGGGTTPEYRWEDFLDAAEAVFAGQFDWVTERVMLAVLRFDGRLRLSESSELPHSMTPEDMLKSFAIQWLARETGLTHLLEMQRVEATAASPALASIVRATIRGAVPPKLPASGIEVVAEVRSSPRREEEIGPLGRGIGQKPTKTLPQERPKITEETIPDRYTRYDVGGLTVDCVTGLSDSWRNPRPAKGFGSRRIRGGSPGRAISYGVHTVTQCPDPTVQKNVVNGVVIIENGRTFLPGHRRRRSGLRSSLAIA